MVFIGYKEGVIMELILATNTSYQLQQLSQIKDNYTAQCKHWIKWVTGNNKEINSETIREYFLFLDNAGYKAKSINVMRQAVKKRVRQLFNNADTEFKMKLEHTLKEIDQEIKKPKVNSETVEIDKVLSKQEYKDILNKCRSNRQRAFIMFLFQTGCRVNELTGITLSDCNDQGEYIKISVTGKGKKERAVRIDTDLFNFIQHTFQGKTYLFETGPGKRYQNDYISKQIKKIGVLIGRKISAHSLRHSFATNMIKTYPEKIDSISKYMGHSDISITLNMYHHTQLSNSELFSLTI
jgi:integrase